MFSTIGGGRANAIEGDFIFGRSSSTIAGGENNQARRGFGMTIGGGFMNLVEESSEATVGGGRFNTIGAGSPNATIGGGRQNQITDALSATVSGGQVNTIESGSSSATVAGGDDNIIQANATAATIGGGFQNTVATNADYASIPGGRSARAGLYGQLAYASGGFFGDGDAQTSLYVLRRTTTSASTNELFLNGSSLRMVVPRDGVWSFDMLIVASSGNDYAGYHLRGLIANFTGLVAVLGTPVKTLLYESDPTWDANVDEDVPNSALVIKVSGAASTTIRWVASVRTVEVIN
jgi:hypothetical protein